VAAEGAHRQASYGFISRVARGPPPAALGRRVEPSSGGLAARAASSLRRRLSPRLRAGRGDQLPGLQAEAAAGVASLAARGAAPRGTAASLAHPLRADHGPLRPVVEQVLREFLKCGLLEHGFARLWCSGCRRSVLVAFSCRGRSFCPSCGKKKQLLWAEWRREELLAPIPHRHAVLTIPRLLRPLFRRRRDLLTQLARAGAQATLELVRRTAGHGARAGLVVSLATAGDLLQWHPHLHLLTTDGGFSAGGSFHWVPGWDPTLLMTLFRERLLATASRPSSTAPA
jgi:transposase-like zinc-binding protein